MPPISAAVLPVLLAVQLCVAKPVSQARLCDVTTLSKWCLACESCLCALLLFSLMACSLSLFLSLWVLLVFCLVFVPLSQLGLVLFFRRDAALSLLRRDVQKWVPLCLCCALALGEEPLCPGSYVMCVLTLTVS